MPRVLGRLSRVLVSADAGATWLWVKGMKEATFSGNRSEIKVTAHDDGDFENYIAGRIDGSIDMKLFYDDTDAGQTALTAAWLAGTSLLVRYVQYPLAPVAQVDTLAVNTLSAAYGYDVTINGVTYSYTSGGGDAEQDILTALRTAIIATAPVTGVVTGTGPAARLTLTGTVPGNTITYTAVDAQLTRANTVVAHDTKAYAGSCIVTKHEEVGGDNDAAMTNTTLRIAGAFTQPDQLSTDYAA